MTPGAFLSMIAPNEVVDLQFTGNKGFPKKLGSSGRTSRVVMDVLLIMFRAGSGAFRPPRARAGAEGTIGMRPVLGMKRDFLVFFFLIEGDCLSKFFVSPNGVAL